MLALLGLSWLFFGMIYTERFLPPFRVLEKWRTPWHRLYDTDVTPGIEGRLEHMRVLLGQSVLVANIGITLMAISFIALAIYITNIFQQKQRRSRENELLHIKNLEIARRNEFIRYISATIGHEFKNNLGRIKRRLDLVDIDSELRERLDENLVKLFSDIDIFKKISDEREAGLIVFKKADLMGMLEETASRYEDLAEFQTSRGPIEADIFAARTLLRTVFENLIDNAVKYKKTEQPKALICLSSSIDSDGPRKYVTLSIRDEGKGMDEHEAEQCFYKNKDSVTKDGESWGQGLYFAKYVIGLHAGKIKVGTENTALGQGTEIIIKLPYMEEAI